MMSEETCESLSLKNIKTFVFILWNYETIVRNKRVSIIILVFKKNKNSEQDIDSK